MNSSNIWQWSAVKTSEAVKNKKISAEDAVQSAIDRMDEVNEKVNAVVVDLREEALVKAKQIDEKIHRNEDIEIQRLINFPKSTKFLDIGFFF